ncbi:helix-turn-helix domain-containing protein [Desulfospira joergensenii]|uniref:helix-turn-helix domain-containing protein n=1 Tax=Desulfospira joergensenii TaxID=53329 RepID=UPI003CC5E62E
MVERISVLVEKQRVEIKDLPGRITHTDSDQILPGVASVFDRGMGFNEAVEQYQRALIFHALNETGWVKARAAQLLKMNRTTLVEKIKKIDLEPEPEMPVF